MLIIRKNTSRSHACYWACLGSPFTRPLLCHLLPAVARLRAPRVALQGQPFGFRHGYGSTENAACAGHNLSFVCEITIDLPSRLNNLYCDSVHVCSISASVSLVAKAVHHMVVAAFAVVKAFTINCNWRHQCCGIPQIVPLLRTTS